MQVVGPDSGDGETQDNSLPIAVPDAAAIGRLLRELLALGVAVESVAHAPPALDDGHVLACYADGAEELRALVLADLRLSVGIGGSLSGMGMAAVDTALEAKTLPSEAFRSLHGAFSSLSVLFDSGAAGQVKLVGLNRADEVAAAGVQRLLKSAWAKGTYAVDVFGYPIGALSIFIGGANRRGGLRIRHRARAEIRFDACVGTRETCDISSGGLYIADARPPGVGTIGHVVLSLDGAPRPLPFQARVAWRSVRETIGGLPPGFGVQLLMTPSPEQDLFLVAVLHLVREAASAPRQPVAPSFELVTRTQSQVDDSRLVLVVDQTQYSRSQITAHLRRAGYSTVAAADGIEALELLSRTDVRMVVCEVNMPRMNGIEFLESIPRREGRLAVPVLMLTNEAEPLVVRRAKMLGAQGWLMKPVQAHVLVATVRRFLGEFDTAARV